jgi:hypothetical protein
MLNQLQALEFNDHKYRGFWYLLGLFFEGRSGLQKVFELDWSNSFDLHSLSSNDVSSTRLLWLSLE